MARITIRQIALDLEAERNAHSVTKGNLEVAQARIEKLLAEFHAARKSGLELDGAMPEARRTHYTGPRTVYEFDANKPGDFRRALDLARENNGVVKRASQH